MEFSEPELDAISYLNAASTICFSFGAFLFSLYIENLRNGEPVGYRWLLDPVGWAAFLFFIFGGFSFITKKTWSKKLKNNLMLYNEFRCRLAANRR